jgi:anti-anti-sigma regulatory factor
LIEASKLIEEKGGKLIVTRPEPSTRRVFDIAGLDKVIAVTA